MGRTIVIEQVIKGIWTHPMSVRGSRYKAMYRFLKWQLIEKPFHKNTGLEKDWFDNRKLMLYSGRAAATGNYYLGLMEYMEMAFCLKYATSTDFFIDCGANVGVYSILLGPECRGGIALEPGSDTFAILEESLHVNKLKNVTAVKKGAGAKNEQLFLTKGNDTTNYVVNQENLEGLSSNMYETIEMIPLDSLGVAGEVTILKIDVEGMEKSVLKGAHNLLVSDELNVVILETFGREDLHDIMINYGFKLCAYNPEECELVVCEKNQISNNGIYVKNVGLAQKRIKEKKEYKISGVSI